MFEKDAYGLPVRLSIRQLRQLSDYCLFNAQQLQKGAELLFEQKVYSASVLLSVLAIEELGKRELLFRHIFVVDSDEDCKKFWQIFRSHKEKLYWAFHKFMDSHMDVWQKRETDYLSLLQAQYQKQRSFATTINDFKKLVAYVNVVEGEVVNPRKLYRRHALPLLRLSRQLLDYHIKAEPTEKIVYYCKNAKKQRRKGESLADFIGRLYLSKKTRSKERPLTEPRRMTKALDKRS